MIPAVPHQALYRRWRAQTFRQIVGQEAVVETLRNAVRADRVSHAILFVGPRGTGKTSLARILAKAINCTDLQDGDACDACSSCVSIREGTSLDLIEIDAASNRGIDDVRSLRERLPYPPGQLRRKVYILDEAHQITKDAWNALLKSIEEPPDFVVFMFASTEPSGFPPAILSRLQRFDVRRLTVTEIEGKLGRILAADARLADEGALRLIARLAAGGMRDAESMLDQLLSAAPGRIEERHVRDLLGLADAEVVETFVDQLVRGEAAAGVELLDSLDERGRDVRALLDQVVEQIRLELVAGLANPSAARHDPAALIAAGRRIAAIDPNRAGIGGLRFQLELALFRSSAGVAHDAASLPKVTAYPAASARADAAKAASGPATTDREPTPAPTPAHAEVSVPAIPAPTQAVPLTRSEPTAVPVAPAAAPPTQPKEPGTPPPTPKTAQGPPTAVKPGAPDADPASESDLVRVRDHWSDIVASVSPSTRAVITECRPMGVDGNVVTLGFPETKAFLKDVAERKRPELEAAFAGFLGRPIRVRSVATNLELPPTASDDLVAEARRIFADDIVDVAEVS